MDLSNCSKDPVTSEIQDNFVKLRHSLNISDVCSEKGTVFEVEKDATSNESCQSISKGSSFVVHEDLFNPNRLNMCSGIKGINFHEEKEVNCFSDSEEENDEPFAKLARNMEDISGDGGVLKMELQPGIGCIISDDVDVVFHYNGFLEYSDEPFDSTLLRNKAQRCSLRHGDIIPGLRVGLQTMRKHEKSRFILRSDYAFGKMGCPPRIPADTSVLYEVTLLDYLHHTALEEFENLAFDEKNAASFEEKLSAAKSYHKEGNTFYRSRHLGKAKDCYKRASWILESMIVANSQEENIQTSMLFRMHNNLAQVNLDMKEPRRACTECHLAFEVPAQVDDEMKAKLYYRYAKAKMLLNDYDASRKYLVKAQKLLPNCNDIPTLLEELFKREAKYIDREKSMCMRMMQMSNKEEIKFATDKRLKDVDNVSLDNQSTLNTLLKNFACDSNRMELLLPPNLSPEEVNFVSRVAKDLQLEVKKCYDDDRKFWKVIKL